MWQIVSQKQQTVCTYSIYKMNKKMQNGKYVQKTLNTIDINHFVFGTKTWSRQLTQ